MRLRRSFKQCRVIIDLDVVDGVRKNRNLSIKNKGVVIGASLSRRDFLSDYYHYHYYYLVVIENLELDY